MKLTVFQKQEVLERGYVKVPGVVPQIMVEQALRHINHSLGQGMNPADMPILRAQSFCPEVQHTPPITDLYHKTPVKDLVESLLGEGQTNTVGGGQIAVRFPSLDDPPRQPGCHLDGMYSPTNGVVKGTIGNFTMLVGVLLSPVTTPYAGNFTVWPGTHHQYEQYFQEHGPESLLRGMPPVEMPEPKQTLGQPGDVFLVHYQLAHAVAPNVSPYPRYAIFFRVKHKEHDRDWKAPMTDIWRHWPGIREIRD
jgi:hypothetical protein